MGDGGVACRMNSSNHTSSITMQLSHMQQQRHVAASDLLAKCDCFSSRVLFRLFGYLQPSRCCAGHLNGPFCFFIRGFLNCMQSVHTFVFLHALNTPEDDPFLLVYKYRCLTSSDLNFNLDFRFLTRENSLYNGF